MPRALLFCSDELSTSALVQILRDLDLEPESCSEIFSALEALTRCDFEVIVADWSEGPEAGFLLKTAGELKSRVPFCLVVIGSDDMGAATAARQAGADIVLRKSLSSGQIKQALLTCDAFLERMRTWLPVEGELEFTGEPQIALQAPTLSTHQPGPEELDPFGPAWSEESIPAQIANTSPRTNRRPSYLRWLATVALVVCTFGIYQFRQQQRRTELLAAVSSRESMDLVYEQALDSAALALTNDDSDTPRIRITPARRAPARSALAIAKLATNALPQVSLQPQVASAVLPESLHSPMPDPPPLRPVAAGASPAVFDVLEPVSLPEDLSEKLLLKSVPPSYPEQALKLGLEGPVVFQAWIARDGTVQELKLVRGPILLGKAAYNAVKQWRYKPYFMNGQAVEARTFVTVNFPQPQSQARALQP